MGIFATEILFLVISLCINLNEPEITKVLDKEEKAFTIVLMTDTHHDYKCKESDLTFISEWIASNAPDLNIGYVAHQGDVGDRRGSGNLEKMLINSRNAIQPIIDCQIPVSMAIGNHDYDDSFLKRTSESFNLENTFGIGFYQNLPGFGGTFKPSNNSDGTNIEGAENHYYVLDVEGQKVLFLTLEYYPRDAVMEWANDLVINSFPNHHVIVITHAYIDEFGKLSNDQVPQKDSVIVDMNNGEDMWNGYFKNWKNLRLVFNGHFIDYPRQSYLQQFGVHGNVVNCHFFNYQNWGYENGKLVNKRKGIRYQASAIRLVTIDIDENRVQIQNFLPQINREIEASDPEMHLFIQ